MPFPRKTNMDSNLKIVTFVLCMEDESLKKTFKGVFRNRPVTFPGRCQGWESEPQIASDSSPSPGVHLEKSNVSGGTRDTSCRRRSFGCAGIRLDIGSFH